jgi:hypothetical protein
MGKNELFGITFCKPLEGIDDTALDSPPARHHLIPELADIERGA